MANEPWSPAICVVLGFQGQRALVPLAFPLAAGLLFLFLIRTIAVPAIAPVGVRSISAGSIGARTLDTGPWRACRRTVSGTVPITSGPWRHRSVGAGTSIRSIQTGWRAPRCGGRLWRGPWIRTRIEPRFWAWFGSRCHARRIERRPIDTRSRFGRIGLVAHVIQWARAIATRRRRRLARFLRRIANVI
jgi:hypothetical protein